MLDVAKVIPYPPFSYSISLGFMYVIEAHQFIAQIKNIETI